MPIQQKQIIVKNFLVNYLSSLGQNNNPTLIFIHGWQSEANIWNEFITKFSENYNCYALDLPGFGKSEPSKHPLTNSDYCEIVEEFIAKLKIGNYILLGHSNGGAVAIKLAAKKPERLQKMILISSAGIREKGKDIKTKNIIAKLVKPFFMPAFMKPLRTRIYKAIGGEDYINAGSNQKTYINIISEDLTPLFETIDTPTLLIWGTQDKSTPISYGKIMHSKIKNSIIEIFEGDHFVFIKEGERIFNVILNFILSK